MKLPLAVMAPMVMSFTSLTVIFVPQAVMVPKLLPTSFSVIFPAVPAPELVKFEFPVGALINPDCVIDPPAFTVSPDAPILPSSTASASAIVIFVPQAVTVPKLFVELPKVILPAVPLPDETKFAVPLIVRFPAPVCVIALPVTSVRLDRLMAAVLIILPVLLLPMVSRLAVMFPISVDVRPKLPVDFVPRSTTVPDVGSSRIDPEAVAFTVLVIVKFWAVI